MSRIFKKHRAGSHKGDNGVVLVVGGSERYTGAVLLAALAALRSGADKVIVAAPEKVAWAISCQTPDLITEKIIGKILLPKSIGQIMKVAEQSDAILVGNGAGDNPKTLKMMRDLIRMLVHRKKPTVIDADGLKAVRLQELKNCLLTPHKTEFDTLCRNSSLNQRAVQKSISNNVIILKGRIDTIISRDRIVLNRTGNEAMTKAGTGDVLAGLCAGFLSQKYLLFEAAIAAAWLNGKTGDRLRREKGYSMTASDMLQRLKVH
ncbi:MAG: NAD(P)H-hydrate dehydratase [Candidatus Woesearchaeota archaeon]